MRSLLFISLLFTQVFSQTFTQRLVAPLFYELGLQPGFQSNPLNLSELEVDKAGDDPAYLDGITYASSRVLSLYGKLNYAPRIFGGRKTRLSMQAYTHQYPDIPERNYESYSWSLKQALGQYRYLKLGYFILPEYYLRNYLFKDPASLISTRQSTRFGTDRFWVGFQQRLSRKNRLDYRLSFRRELYQAPFAHFDLKMKEVMIRLESDQFRRISFSLEARYGWAENANRIDTKDRSYQILNLRPTLVVIWPGKHQLRLSGRYGQRAYGSEQIDDPIHVGRYQEEFRLDITFLPKLTGPIVIEPFVGYRERRIDSDDAAIRDLKSFTRYWFGVRLGYKSVIDMYF